MFNFYAFMIQLREDPLYIPMSTCGFTNGHLSSRAYCRLATQKPCGYTYKFDAAAINRELLKHSSRFC